MNKRQWPNTISVTPEHKNQICFQGKEIKICLILRHRDNCKKILNFFESLADFYLNNIVQIVVISDKPQTLAKYLSQYSSKIFIRLINTEKSVELTLQSVVNRSISHYLLFVDDTTQFKKSNFLDKLIDNFLFINSETYSQILTNQHTLLLKNISGTYLLLTKNSAKEIIHKQIDSFLHELDILWAPFKKPFICYKHDSIKYTEKCKNITKSQENFKLIQNTNYDKLLSIDFKRTQQGISKFQKSDSSVKKILYIGPQKFLNDTGYKNVKLIYPSLFNPLKGCEFHILHGNEELPDFTQELIDKYDVKFHRVADGWLENAVEVIKHESIDVVTNVFFGYRFGNIAAKAAKETGCRSVVRFPANEIYARECGGAYNVKEGKRIKKNDIKKEKQAIDLADKVIAISPWEEKRLQKLVAPENRHKIVWCMRGINIDKYSPSKNSNEKGKKACKFLYAGRKSMAKGHHLIEEAAAELFQTHPDIKFYFAGQFSEGKKTKY